MDVLERCQFVHSSAEDLSFFPDESIDVITTRSVLIYVKDKQRALREFCRVLKRGGRISLFETVTLPALRRSGEKWPGVGTSVYPAADLEPVSDLVTRFVSGLNFAASQSMSNTDHIGYLHLCEDAGFKAAKVELHLGTRRRRADLQTLLNQSLNPHFPTPAEHMDRMFTPLERERFVAHLEELTQTDAGVSRLSSVFISAVKE
jgi:SAM-dependent methyltransferase